MKKMTLTQMEQTQAQGWFECATSALITIGATAVCIGSAGVLAITGGAAVAAGSAIQTGKACAEAWF